MERQIDRRSFLDAAGRLAAGALTGGFWILEAADIDEALAWARKGAIACRAAGEVRELLFRPAATQRPGGGK